MIEKTLEFDLTSQAGDPLVEVILPGSLVKTAGELHPEVASFIRRLTPNPNKLYLLVNALGAGEYWGPNSKGDYFSEEALSHDGSDYGFRTFYDAGIYQHHSNKDRKKSLGKVVLSIWNDRMKRVELILEIDRAQAVAMGAEDILRKIDMGGHVCVSMGARVEEDICSICGHASKTLQDYCNHVNGTDPQYGMCKILPDGRICCVYNPKPRFFDISIVYVGADRTARSMLKVASASMPVLRFPMAPSWEMLFGKTASGKEKQSAHKLAEIIKSIPSDAAAGKIVPDLERIEGDLPESLMDAARSHGVAGELLGALASAGIIARPDEFSRMLRPGEKFDSGRMTSEVPEELKELLSSLMEDRSFLSPSLTPRVVRIIIVKRGGGPLGKEAQSVSKEAMLSSGYLDYRDSVLERLPEFLASARRNFFGEQDGLAKSAGEELLSPLGAAYALTAYLPWDNGSVDRVGAIQGFLQSRPQFASGLGLGE